MGWLLPVAGAVALLLTGVEPLVNAAYSIARQWNVLLFILGLMLIAGAAEESGAFAWIARFVQFHACGSRRRLFVLLYATATAVTVLLSNDATAVALTPIVYRVVADRAESDAKPFLFACIFVANAASFGLPFSNPANVLILPHPRLLPYLVHLAAPQIAVILATFAILFFFYRANLKGRFAPIEPPALDRGTLVALFGLGAVVLSYFVALALEAPLGPVAMLGAAFVLAASRIPALRAASHVSWKTLALLLALFVLLDAVARAGFVAFALDELDHAVRYGGLAANLLAAGGSALLSNVINNLPVAVAASYVVAHVHAQHVAYPLIVGVDAGPNLITTGSLATILWLGILHDRGVRVSVAEYLRLGLLVVPATLAICVLWLTAIGR